MSTHKITPASEMPPDFTDPRSPLKGRSPVPWSKKMKTSRIENHSQNQIADPLVKSFHFEEDHKKVKKI